MNSPALLGKMFIRIDAPRKSERNIVEKPCFYLKGDK
jgi:hypothetical protein